MPEWEFTKFWLVLCNLYNLNLYNLISGSKRLPNLSEIFAPTVPRKDSNTHPGGTDDADGSPGDDHGDARNVNNNNAEERWNGSYHCENFKKGKSCDVCSHMEERSFVTSFHFKTKHAIHVTSK